jgi:hypothetical protein
VGPHSLAKKARCSSLRPISCDERSRVFGSSGVLAGVVRVSGELSTTTSLESGTRFMGRCRGLVLVRGLIFGAFDLLGFCGFSAEVT